MTKLKGKKGEVIHVNNGVDKREILESGYYVEISEEEAVKLAEKKQAAKTAKAAKVAEKKLTDSATETIEQTPEKSAKPKTN